MRNVMNKLYPGAKPEDYEFIDKMDGSGVQIDLWNVSKLGPKPSITYLLSQKVIADKDYQKKTNLEKINTLFEEACSKPFSYNGNNYAPDTVNIQGMASICMLLPLNDNLPTVNGKWTTLDMEVDGIANIKVPFTCGEFISFAQAFANRRVTNYSIKLTLEEKIRSSYQAGYVGQSPEEIVNSAVFV